VWNTVFDNTRATTELGRKPVPFSQYSYPLLKFSRENHFEYRYQPWPAVAEDPPHDGLRSGSVGEPPSSARKPAGCWAKASPWQPGEKLKLLFAGYNGTRNMGSDVRVEEMLRQLRHILGAENVDFSVMTQNFDLTQGYFAGAEQVHLPGYFSAVFVAMRFPSITAWWCEGSMFKSKFANALTTMMIGSLGIAAAQNKLAVGYGAEAGHMDPLVADVRPLLQEFADDHAQRRIAHCAS
jgi:hypothetical protein